MQLTLLRIVFVFICSAIGFVSGQANEPEHTTRQIREQPDPVKASFLYNYYQQEGDHSAVTGGTGTEALTDQAATIIVTVPLDQVSELTVETSVNHYTSASSDNIDFNVSSASSDDYRGQLYIGYAHKLPEYHQEFGFRFGGSIESDVISTSLSINWQIENSSKNRWLSVLTQAYWDDWLPIFPAELRSRGEELIETDKRRTYSLSLSYGQVVTKNLQFAVFSDLVLQRGLLSTPFHRVYFEDEFLPRVERLPSTRVKWPLGTRLNWFVTDHVIMRLYYRFYIDDFDITANTIAGEFPIKLSEGITFYPFFRFHRQSAAQYFREFGQHSPTQDYFTSDFDLSSFDSHKKGLGVKYNPIYGLTRFKFPNPRTTTVIQSIELQYANYQRQDGLSFYAISLGLDFLFL